jgi:pentapeptide repeat protein
LAIASGVALTVVLAVMLIVYVPLGLQWYLSPTTDLPISQRKDLVQGLASVGQALAVGLTGAAGLIGLAFTWRNLRQTRESTQRTLELTEQGQITDRFTRAIEQLGKTEDDGKTKVLEIRLGGIYALERIARESEKDYWPIMEVLTAYVRQHRRWPKEERKAAEAAAVEKYKQAPPLEILLEGVNVPPPIDGPSPLDPDIQAIITVLRRRTRSYHHGEPERLDLHATNLLGANLSGVNLEVADLRESNLTGANLLGAHLLGANLSSADLRLADLFGASVLWEAHLFGANLEGADLRGAAIAGANLVAARLSGADLSGADLTRAHYLTQAQLEETTGDENTTLPSDLKPPAHRGVKTDEQIEED